MNASNPVAFVNIAVTYRDYFDVNCTVSAETRSSGRRRRLCQRSQPSRTAAYFRRSFSAKMMLSQSISMYHYCHANLCYVYF